MAAGFSEKLATRISEERDRAPFTSLANLEKRLGLRATKLGLAPAPTGAGE